MNLSSDSAGTPGNGTTGLAALCWPPPAEDGQGKTLVHGAAAVFRLDDAVEQAGVGALVMDGDTVGEIFLKKELFRTICLPRRSAIIMVTFVATTLYGTGS